MKKFSLILLAAVLLASALIGCGHGESDTPDNDSVQNTGTTIQEPSTATLPDDTSGDSDDSLELLPASYAKNLLSLTDTATSNGISYSVLEVQRTKEFGSRTLENLIDLSRGGTDENGNLLGDEDYLFLTIQFTNTSDQTVEILRNQGGLRAINSEGQVLHYDSETVYCDQKWDGGTSGEVFLWALAPNESVTSEIGWIGRGWAERDETVKALLENSQDWSLYYEVEASGDTNESFFIDLELDAK